MKAVNLIPAEAGRISGSGRQLPRGPGYVVLGLLGIALAFVTLYVLATNTISERKAKLAAIQQQANEVQAQAQRLANYVQFAKLAQQRADTVRQLASSRFDWRAALSDLSKVVPPNTSLQSLLGTVAPGVTVTGPGGGAGGASPADTNTLRSDIPNPAFELRGCTRTQDDVARLMSRLRVMNGVTRVTLADSVKQDSAGGAATASASGTSSVGCRPNQPSFDLVVFFQPLPGAAAAAGQLGSTPVSTPASTPAPSGSTGTASASSVTSTTPTTPAGGSTPVSTSSGGSK